MIQIDSEAIARDTLDFVRVKSETGAEAPGSMFLYELMRREGFDPQLDEAAPGRPNVVCRIPGSGGGPNLVINGHTDTIPIGVSDPPGRDGDWIIGRGSEDMKGGLVAMVHAASALRRAGVRLRGDLYLTGVVGHEAPVGKKEGPSRLIERLRDRSIPADAVLIVEGPCAIWAASLGFAIFRVRVISPHGQVHTSTVPYEHNPARWTGKFLDRLHALETQFDGEGAHPLCGRERLNVGIVRGGDYMNRLPTPIEVIGTWRWKPGKTVMDVEAMLRGVCAEMSAASELTFECDIEHASAREPFETPADHPLVRAVSAASRELTGSDPAVIGMALVGDANLYANEAGVPSIYYGPAYKTAHSDHERVSIAQLAHCAGVYARAAMSFCGVESVTR